MTALLTEFTELVQNIVKIDMPREEQLEHMAGTLEAVTDELKTYCSSWKTATQQAEDGARQMAQGNEELEETKKNMAEKNEELEERRRHMAEREEQLEERRGYMAKREEQLEERRRYMAEREEQLEQRRKQIDEQEGQLHRRASELEARERLFDRISSKNDNVTNFGNGLEELSTKLRAIQPAVVETLQGLTDAISKAKADASKAEANASKTKADCQRSLVHHSVSRYEESRAKRGLGPDSPEMPVSKRRRRQNSVGSAGMLTNFGPPEPLPEDIMDRIPSPRNRGRVFGVENARREVDTSPTRTPSSGAQGVLGSHVESSSSMDPATATATGQTIFNPESSNPGTPIQSSQSTDSATCPPGLSRASDEVKDVWRQIEFPIDWDMGASQTLLHGFNKATDKKTPRSRPAGLLDSSSAQPNCFLCRVSKYKSTLDNGDDKSCSTCKAKLWPCVRVSFVADDLANVEYDDDGEPKRWKLTIREVD